MNTPMNSLHLFAGVGGGILADKILGNTIVGAVEIEPYCRAVLKQRQEEGLLEPFPLFEDVRAFNGDEIEQPIDVVCAGFPCQDISCAGKGAGIEGEKSSLFYELVRVCRTVKPTYIFLENSPSITGRGLGTVLCKIAEIGYDAEWTNLSAGICGAPHLRDRWWCLCKRQQSETERSLQPKRIIEDLQRRFSELGNTSFGAIQGSDKPRPKEERSDRDSQENKEGNLFNSSSLRRGQILYVCNAYEQIAKGEPRTVGTDSGNGTCEEVQTMDRLQRGQETVPVPQRSYPDSNSVGRNENGDRLGISDEETFSGTCCTGSADFGWWSAEPPVDRVVDELPHRVDRLKGLGNAQVPVVAALAFYLLMERYTEDN